MKPRTYKRLMVLLALIVVAFYIFIFPRIARAEELKGSHTIARYQNEAADQDDLTRFQTYSQVKQFIRAKRLVALPVNEAVAVDDRLKPQWRWCRPWTAHFLDDLGHAYFEEFHVPLRVNSAVRTVGRQQQLQKVNGNAAPVSGDRRSSHLTGATIDLAAKGLSSGERQWIEAVLRRFMQQGIVIAVKEKKQQWCFHVMVRRAYDERRTAKESALQGGGK